ncbi:hypothetical protein D3C72_1754410 [compost metagenome]
MRNGHTMAQASGAQAFTCKQTVGDQGTRESMQAFKQQTGFFERAFFTGDIHAH